MSKAKGTTMKAPCPTQEELETKFRKAEQEAIHLRWAVNKTTVWDAFEELRGVMYDVQEVIRGAANQLYSCGQDIRDQEGLNLIALSITLYRFSDLMSQNLEETESFYMRRLPAGKPR